MATQLLFKRGKGATKREDSRLKLRPFRPQDFPPAIPPARPSRLGYVRLLALASFCSPPLPPSSGLQHLSVLTAVGLTHHVTAQRRRTRFFVCSCFTASGKPTPRHPRPQGTVLTPSSPRQPDMPTSTFSKAQQRGRHKTNLGGRPQHPLMESAVSQCLINIQLQGRPKLVAVAAKLKVGTHALRNALQRKKEAIKAAAQSSDA